MDAFFASVEQRDNPELRNTPVVVGGQPNSRGVVAAASYEARAFGIRSAMSCANAYKLCPQAHFVAPNFDKYREASEQIRAIFAQHTDLVEPLSLDEAFLDVSDSLGQAGSASELAKKIREQIFKRTGLNASAGISYNKFLAKIASDINKPNGQCVITPLNTLRILDALPIRRFYGIGAQTETKLLIEGIESGFDLRECSRVRLQQLFGHSAERYYNMARGIDERPVRINRQRKSIGTERTFAKNINDVQHIDQKLTELVHELDQRCAAKSMIGGCLTLKVRFSDFSTLTRQTQLRDGANQALVLEHARSLLNKINPKSEPIRLLGLTMSRLEQRDQHRPQQLSLGLE